MEILVSTVIRSSTKSEGKHGGLYFVDIENEEVEKVLDKDNINIDWAGRGGERGLRGIGFYKDSVILTDHNALLFYSKDFDFREEYRNQYLGGCHEVDVRGNKLYITSTKYNSILVFDLKKREFEVGYYLDSDKNRVFNFHPQKQHGPEKEDINHINNVHVDGSGLYISALGSEKIWKVNENSNRVYVKNEKGTHNARPYKNGLAYVHTRQNKVCYRPSFWRSTIKTVEIPSFPEEKLVNSGLPEEISREKWARGLAITDKENDIFVVGTTPATLLVCNMQKESILKTIHLSMDLRKTIHGLEKLPFKLNL